MREAAYGQVRPLGVAQGAEVAVQHERVMERQEVVNAARGQQAAKVTQAGLQAEGDEQHGASGAPENPSSDGAHERRGC